VIQLSIDLETEISYMLDGIKSQVKKYAHEGGFLFRFLSLISSVVESESKIFSFKEALLFPWYGQTYIDKKYHAYLSRLSKYLKDREVDLIDIGANRGWFIRLSPRFFKIKNIYAYEPAEFNNKYLEPLKSKFPQMVIRNLLLGEKTETKSFYKYGTDGLSSTRKLNDAFSLPANFDTKLEETTEMRSIALSDDLKKIGLERSRRFLIKIDTQGAELEILKGARELFEQNSVTAVVIELLVQDMYQNQSSWLEILNFFESYNFKILDILTCLRQPDGTISEFDGIFVKH
jgi:FkbM family methyltransferase